MKKRQQRIIYWKNKNNNSIYSDLKKNFDGKPRESKLNFIWLTFPLKIA